MSTSVVALSSSLPFCCWSLKVCLCGWVLSYKVGPCGCFCHGYLGVFSVGSQQVMGVIRAWPTPPTGAETILLLSPCLWPPVARTRLALWHCLLEVLGEKMEGVLLWRMWPTPLEFARPKGRHPCFWNDVTSCLSWNSVQLWLRSHKRFQWWRSLLLSTPLIKAYLEDCLRDSQMQVLTFSKAAEISIYSYNSVKWPKSSGCPWDAAQPHGLLPVPGHLLGALASLMSKARHLHEWGLS